MNPSPPSGLRRLASAAVAAIAIAAAACAAAVGLPPKEIEAHGVVVLRAPAEKVYKASAEALKALGYELEVEQPEKGLIVTKRRSIAMDGPGGATEHAYFRTYKIEIRSGGGGTARVKATPAMFEDEKNVSDKRAWDLDGPLGEHELWKQLFAKIEQLL
jgi:hypothetical protein